MKSKLSLVKIVTLTIGGIIILSVGIAIGSGSTKQDVQKSINTSEINDELQNLQETTQAAESSPSEIQPAEKLYQVVRVVDGDTIEIEDGQKVRYIGIDTPETVDPSKSVQCYGKEAADKNKELVEGKMVRLEKDVSETDQYGRLLHYIYVGDTFVNDYLVRQGYAHSSTYPPDVKYQTQFTEAESEARENNRGLWGSVCACENGKETNRVCIGCNKAKLTKTYWDCSTYTEEITDDSCTSDCQVSVPIVTPSPVPVPTPTPTPAPTSTYICDCSKTCTEITTCEEAQYHYGTVNEFNKKN